MNLKIFSNTFAVFLLFQVTSTFGQERKTPLTVMGKIMDSQSIGIPGANIRLRNIKDTTDVKYAETDSIGKYRLLNLRSGAYQVQVSYTGFITQTQELTLDAQQALTEIPPIILLPTTNILSTITISANRPLVEQQLDRTVLNVEGTATSAGVSALEVLEKAPGITIDQNGSISMRGKRGVIVLINDKPVQLSGTELSEYLRSIPSANMDKVELISSPPAKYDAAGVSGIINIKTKKGNRPGINGNLALNAGHGKHIKSSNGGNINYSSEKINLYANYNYAYRGDFVLMDIERSFTSQQQGNGDFKQGYDQKIDYGAHTVRTGMDYKLAPRTIIGTEFFGNFVSIDRSTKSLSTLFGNAGIADARQDTENLTLNRRNNFGLNLNLDQKIDTSGSGITVDLDYAAYTLDDQQTYDISFENVNPAQLRAPLSFYNDSEGSLQIRSAGINYLKNFKGIKFEGGLKASSVRSATSLDFYDRTNGNMIYDQNLSNDFEYREDIQSAFVNASGKTSRLQLQAGLRIESTISKGSRLGSDYGFRRNYAQLFPSAAMSYNLNKHHALGFAISRRISRPTFNQINPFFYFLDLSTKLSGNPELLPSLSYSIDLNYVYKGKYIFSFGYFYTQNPIVDAQLIDTNDPKAVIQLPINLRRYQVLALNLTVPWRISGWFVSNNNLGAYNGIYSGQIQGSSLSAARPYFNLNSSNTFTMKDWSLQLVATYNGRQYNGNNQLSPVTTFTAGLQRRLFAKNATLGLNFSDIFWGNVIRSTSRLAGYSNKLFWRRDSRVALLNFSYRFGGKNQVTERRKGSAEEEKRRAG